MSPSWVDSRPDLTAVGGVVRLTSDPDCVGQRPSRSETGFAVFLGALAYFWSVGWLNKVPRVTSLFFHSGKGNAVWSVTCAVENMSMSVTFTSSTYHLLDFSMAVYCGYKKLTVWAFFSPLSFSWLLWRNCDFITWFIRSYKTCSLNTKTHIFTFFFLSYSVAAFNNLCTFQRYLPGIYMVFFLVSSEQ